MSFVENLSSFGGYFVYTKVLLGCPEFGVSFIRPPNCTDKYYHMKLINSGEDRNYPTCAFLLYDGIHYDPLVRKLGSETSLQGIFPVDDDSVVMEALKIAKDAFQVSSID